MPATTALRALAPAAALALFTFGAGTLTGGASAVGAGVGHGVLLVAALYGARAWRDPLRLGRLGRWSVLLVHVAVVASWLASPVGRAGLVAVLTLPAWLLAPAAVARCWRGAAALRLGTVAVAAVVLAVAGTALVGRFVVGDARAAAPLGHHNLLAVWLLALLPLATVGVLPAVWGSGWVRWGGRGVAVAAGAAGLGALVLTGSLSGFLGLAVALLVAVMLWLSRARRSGGGRVGALLAAVLALAAGAAALPRLVAVLAGTDPSLMARRTYWAAGWRGALERPLLGWGPGAVPWTVGAWLRPVPGVNPPGQVVGDLHSLPLQLFYELGAAGLALVAALAVVFAVRRWRRGADRPAVTASLVALTGAATALVTVAPLAVTAVPAALALAAGAALAAEDERERPPAPRWPVVVYALLALVALGRLDLAHWHHDRSLAGSGGEASALAAAVRLDPTFPLYRARLARLRGAAGTALVAARGAPGVAALWLSAGELAAAVGDPRAAAALERACDLDPLGASAPFLRTREEPAAAAAPRRLARALLAEPRLAAAVWLEGREGLLAAALEEVRRWPGVTAGWRSSMVEAVTGWDVEVSGEVARLTVVADGSAADSLSLHAFRRRPRRFELAAFPVRRELARQVALPPAAVLRETSPRAFAADRGCGAGGG